MLAKCTNSYCSAGFRYLHEGKLFRLEIHPTVSSSKAKAVEYFWLCSRCSQALTLRLAHDGRVIAIPLQDAVHPDAAHKNPQVVFISLSRESSDSCAG